MNSTQSSTLPRSPPSSSTRQNTEKRKHNHRVSSLRAFPTLLNLWDPSSTCSLQNISQWIAIRWSWTAERAAFASAERFWAYRCDGENTFCRRTTPRISLIQLNQTESNVIRIDYIFDTRRSEIEERVDRNRRVLSANILQIQRREMEILAIRIERIHVNQLSLIGTNRDSTVAVCSAAIFPSISFSFTRDSSVISSSSLSAPFRSRQTPPSLWKYDGLHGSSFIDSIEFDLFSACSARWRNSWMVASSLASPFGLTLSRTAMHFW